MAFTAVNSRVFVMMVVNGITETVALLVQVSLFVYLNSRHQPGYSVIFNGLTFVTTLSGFSYIGYWIHGPDFYPGFFYFTSRFHRLIPVTMRFLSFYTHPATFRQTNQQAVQKNR